MAEVSAEARIEAPAEKIWDRLTDWSGYGEWNATHTNFPNGGPEKFQVGGTFAENMKLMGFPAEVTWTIEELEPGHVLAIRGKGPMAVNVTTRYTLTPDGDATSVRIDGEFTGARSPSWPANSRTRRRPRSTSRCASCPDWWPESRAVPHRARRDPAPRMRKGAPRKHFHGAPAGTTACRQSSSARIRYSFLRASLMTFSALSR